MSFEPSEPAAGPSQSSAPQPSNSHIHGPSFASNEHPSAPSNSSGAPPPQSTATTPYSAASTALPASGASAIGGQSYYDYTKTSWNTGWNAATYPYSAQNTGSYQQGYSYTQPYIQGYQAPYQVQGSYSSFKNVDQKPVITKPKSPSPPSSPPPPEFHTHWDEAMKTFFTRLGLSQASSGFEMDLLVMNSEWERLKVPDALDDLVKNIQALRNHDNNTEAVNSGTSKTDDPPRRSFEERTLDSFQFAAGAEARTQTSINKSISSFLAQSRARNDASNRAEFLHSIAEKRRRLNNASESPWADDVSTCARTDAKTLDRDVQMKYDIAKNEDGPLRRTMKIQRESGTIGNDASSSSIKGKQKAQTAKTEPDVKAERPEYEADLTSDRHSGLDERLVNVETHLAVRYVPSPPRSLLERLKLLEDHIIRLEKDYPPWAALHFNQPNRGWPPPPRSTPVIVAPHLSRTTSKDQNAQNLASGNPSSGGPGPPATSGVIKAKHTNSSLHKAVLERLEVQQAKNDLAGGR